MAATMHGTNTVPSLSVLQASLPATASAVSAAFLMVPLLTKNLTVEAFVSSLLDRHTAEVRIQFISFFSASQATEARAIPGPA
jgi:hypothetical protein